jgi:hypothetical protein
MGPAMATSSPSLRRLAKSMKPAKPHIARLPTPTSRDHAGVVASELACHSVPSKRRRGNLPRSLSDWNQRVSRLCQVDGWPIAGSAAPPAASAGSAGPDIRAPAALPVILIIVAPMPPCSNRDSVRAPSFGRLRPEAGRMAARPSRRCVRCGSVLGTRARSI